MTADPGSKSATVQAAILGLVMTGIWGASGLFGWAAPPTWISALLFPWLIALSWYDFRDFRLPDWLTLPLIIAGLAFQTTSGSALWLAAMGAAIGYVLIWGLRLVWLKARKVHAIGLGDAKLLAGAGAWLGPLGLPYLLIVASGTALVYAAFRPGPGGEKTVVPFGPFLALGFWSVWVFSTALALI